jgi:hypothetical protein
VSMCPVCNGLHRIENLCSNCQRLLDDVGKIESFYDPYSPYRQWDELKTTNGFPDLANHECMHVLVCPDCGLEQVVAIKETELL